MNIKPFQNALSSFQQFVKKHFYRSLFLSAGLASTIWFLLRVVPKPSRAGYPCMRATAPLMSGFILYLVSITGTWLLFRTAWKKMQEAKYFLAITSLGACVAMVMLINMGQVRQSWSFSHEAESISAGVLPDGSNNPMGSGFGIFPGRVAWAWNPSATNENCPNVITDAYFMPKNNNQDTINKLADESIRCIGGAPSVRDSWDALFKSFNLKKNGLAIGYTNGQTIFIKINNGQAGWATNWTDLSETGNDSPVTKVKKAAMSNTTPSTVLAFIRQLVDSCGIPQDKIFVGEPMTHVYKSMYDLIHANYPNVIVLDKDGYTNLGRTKSSGWTGAVINYSDKGTIMPDAISDVMMNEMYNADYLINIAALKAHARAGVTFGAKLHFGSHGNHAGGGANYSSFHLHQGLISVTDNDKLDANARVNYKMYRVLTDLMGHKKLGGNTLLFVVDGLWGGIEATDMPVKWQTSPFKGDFPNSLFVSQDGVAIESVCLDFLRAEATKNAFFKNRPLFPAVDDHLHQAADSKTWPVGFVYDPEDDGTPMPSMGIHEHWNDSLKKQYSGNLAKEYGIELVSLAANRQVNNVPAVSGSLGKIRIPGPNAVISPVNDLNSLFSDPDGEPLFFTAKSNDSKLTASIVHGNTLKLTASSSYQGPSDLELTASDGKDSVKYLVQAWNSATIYANEALTPPDVDGVPDDACWEEAAWNYIDQTWIPWGETVDSSDFSGRFKICWSAAENLLYFLVEITDDSIVDGYTYRSSSSNNNYPDYDIVEVFIDENNSKGKHVFDGTGQTGTDWGTNAENAFSYHIAANQPEVGFVTSDFAVCDIAGVSWSNYTIANYSDHFPAYRMYRESAHHYYHEFSLKVFNDTYNPKAPNESSRTVLQGDQTLGLSLAYCDNDTATRLSRDNFFGSVYVPQSRYNDHWMNALDFGKLVLLGNHSPIVTSAPKNVFITQYDMVTIVSNSLKSYFDDIDGDSLFFSVSCDSADIEVFVSENSVLSIVAHKPFRGPAEVKISASDGKVSAETSFLAGILDSGIDQKMLVDGIQIWPNPSQGNQLIIRLKDHLEVGEVKIEIFRVNGQVLLREAKQICMEGQALELNVSSLSPGQYILKAHSKKGDAVARFIRK